MIFVSPEDQVHEACSTVTDLKLYLGVQATDHSSTSPVLLQVFQLKQSHSHSLTVPVRVSSIWESYLPFHSH